jgi:hypothetical protein
MQGVNFVGMMTSIEKSLIKQSSGFCGTGFYQVE